MDVKEVTKTAREYVVEIFADEQITNLGLEEVVYDVESERWRITFGFARPWDRQGDMGVRMGLKAPRAYKVVSMLMTAMAVSLPSAFRFRWFD